MGKLLALGVGILALVWVVRQAPLGGAALGAWAQQQGLWCFCLVATGVCAVGVPRQVVALAAGYAAGPVAGSMVALVCETLACLLNYLVARWLLRHWLRAKLPARWLTRLDAAITVSPFVTTLCLRLLPVGNNLALNLAAGLSGVAPAPFLAGSALGYIPQTVIFALIGSGVRIDRTAELAVGVFMLALSSLLGVAILRSRRKREVLF